MVWFDHTFNSNSEDSDGEEDFQSVHEDILFQRGFEWGHMTRSSHEVLCLEFVFLVDIPLRLQTLWSLIVDLIEKRKSLISHLPSAKKTAWKGSFEREYGNGSSRY